MSRESATMSTVPSATRTSQQFSPNSKILSKASRDLLDNEDVVKVMKRKLGSNDFRINHWSLDPVPDTHGYMGQYFNLRVRCSVNNKEPEMFVFFAKAMPPRNSPQYDFNIRCDILNREIRVYEELMPRMGAGNGMDWKVDCYLGKKDVILVLEDATLDGYAMPDKYVSFGFEEQTVLMRSLAKFHSRSFILEEKLRNDLGKSIKDVYGDLLEESLFPVEDAAGGNIMLPGIQGACSMVDLVDELDDSSKQSVKSRIAKWSYHMPKLLESSDKYRNVICHRDVWVNNFMLKRDEFGHPQGCYLLDFQFLSYLPPAVDLMLSLYLNSDRKTRMEHFEALTKIYHDALRKELKILNFDVDSFVGWEEFKESCESYRSLAIIYVVINQQIMLMDQETIDKYFKHSPELLDEMLRGPGRCELVCKLFRNIKEFRVRITENIMDAHQWLSDEVL